MRRLLCLLAMVAPLLAHGEISRGELREHHLRARLRAGGKLFVKPRDKWTQVSLDGFKKHLAAEKRWIDKVWREQGRSAFEGAGRFKLYVALDIVPEAPWQNVQWLMEICAEERIFKLQLVSGANKLLVKLPVAVDKGLERPPNELVAQTIVVARKFERKEWGGILIDRPTVTEYRFGDERTTDLAAVRKRVVAAKRAAAAAGATVVGLVRAAPRVPLGEIMRVLDAYLAEKLTTLDFYGTSIPNKEVRAAKTLPYPKSNYVAED